MHQDDSDNLEVLYLMAYCNFQLRNYLTTEEILEEFNSKCKNCEDEELLTAKQELETELSKQDPTKGNDYEEADGEENEWVDEDDENLGRKGMDFENN
jgi:hypothetical protein